MGFSLLVKKKKNEREKKKEKETAKETPTKADTKINRVLGDFTALKWIVLCCVLIVDESYMLM